MGSKISKKLDEIVEKSLRGAALWDEVKDDLNKSALALSGGNNNDFVLPERSQWGLISY